MTDSGHAEGAGPAVPVITVFVGAQMSRRIVRIVSRRVSDVPGVVSLEVDAAGGRLQVRGDVDHQELLAAIRSAGFAATATPGSLPAS